MNNNYPDDWPGDIYHSPTCGCYCRCYFCNEWTVKNSFNTCDDCLKNITDWIKDCEERTKLNFKQELFKYLYPISEGFQETIQYINNNKKRDIWDLI